LLSPPQRGHTHCASEGWNGVNAASQCTCC
jgi:hypothetical protein